MLARLGPLMLCSDRLCTCLLKVIALERSQMEISLHAFMIGVMNYCNNAPRLMEGTRARRIIIMK